MRLDDGDDGDYSMSLHDNHDWIRRAPAAAVAAAAAAVSHPPPPPPPPPPPLTALACVVCGAGACVDGHKLKQCSGCSSEAIRYCSRDCQKAHWPEHKDACKGKRTHC